MVTEDKVGRLFDLKMHDHDALISVAYERHNAEVVPAIAPTRLLVYHPAHGWGPFWAFRGAAAPDTPMPHANSTEEFQARFANASPGEGPSSAAD